MLSTANLLSISLSLSLFVSHQRTHTHTHTHNLIWVRMNSYNWLVTFSTKVVLQASILFQVTDVLLMFTKIKLNSVAWVHERTIPTERPPLVSEVNDNFWWIAYFNITNFINTFLRWLLNKSFCLYISYGRAKHSAAGADLEIQPILLRSSKQIV
jgi:hypothetical protein